MTAARIGLDGDALRRETTWGVAAVLHGAQQDSLHARAAGTTESEWMEYGPDAPAAPATFDGSDVSPSIFARGRRWLNLGRRQIELWGALKRDRIGLWVALNWIMPLPIACRSVLALYDLTFLQGQGEPQTLSQWARRQWVRWQATRACLVVTGSEWAKGRLTRELGIVAEHIAVLPVPPRPAFTSPAVAVDASAQFGIVGDYILAVGDFHPEQNLLSLVEAYSRLAPAIRARTRLVLAGPINAYAQALARTIATWGVTDHVHLLGPVADRDLPALMSGASLFVWPARDTEHPLPALEALAVGAPVVASASGPLREWIGDGALWVDTNRVDSIAAAMSAVLTNDQVCSRLQQDAAASLDRLSMERLGRQARQLMETLAQDQVVGTVEAVDAVETRPEALAARSAGGYPESARLSPARAVIGLGRAA